MNQPTTRRIFRSSATSQNEIREVLEALFAAEILSPSRCLWVVSPWISDVELLDNRTGRYSSLVPSWSRRQIRLTEVLSYCLKNGTHLMLASRDGIHSRRVLQSLSDFAASHGIASQINVVWNEDLHLKGILSDDYFLSGSMNLTRNGIEVLEETITIETAASAVESARIAFLKNYGRLV